MQNPFWGPIRQSRRTVGPAPDAQDEPTHYVPNPIFRGTGTASPEVVREREQERRMSQQVAQVRERVRPQVQNGHQLARRAAVALVRAGLTQDQVVSALVGLISTVREADRISVVEMNVLIQHAQSEHADDKPEPAA